MASEGNSEPDEKLNRELRSIRRDLKRLINDLKNTEELTFEYFPSKTVEFKVLTVGYSGARCAPPSIHV